ncbi:tRNA splicing endonuclease SEN2 [Mytilinidion resinicola]|uniref:tRNA-splicing endonuclease subunit Sen2 n=1 Tax=Mytilinidion resinicola TaxID=574789 RepID=A0A6A6Z777_9PEZI|nr:tRNA splicing endonuclease SEN2 [Mytilinidion resinicola]KAF2816668.1 tRNA splicing endonuclease SEN2 [Mytilinidion resinicola]
MTSKVEGANGVVPPVITGHEDGKLPEKVAVKPQERTPRPKKPNYAQIHSHPLPLEIYPVPSFIPHNPLSVARIILTVVSQYFWPPSSHLPNLYKGYFSHDTQAVHITDAVTIRALWEQGFYGKGTLSRSEPRWLDQEKRRRGLIAFETSEEVTRQRRETRRQFKLERARKERETIEQQLKDEGKLPVGTHIPESHDESELNGAADASIANNVTLDSVVALPSSTLLPDTETVTTSTQDAANVLDKADEDLDEEIEDQEHLQLTCEEAFFLVYALGALEVSDKNSPMSSSKLMGLFAEHSTFPPGESQYLQPDGAFLLKYVVYHHFRSLGWVVRPGVKFAVDYLLYNRGPVFSHAEFAVIIIPSYSDPYWSEHPDQKAAAQQGVERDWWWLHRVNRVQTQVHKSLVLVYVDIPPPTQIEVAAGQTDIGKILKQYKVREFVLRRWIPNRNRD